MVNEDVNCQTEEQKNLAMRSLALCVYIATYYRLEVEGVKNDDSAILYTQATQQEKEALAMLWSVKQLALEEEIMALGGSYEVFDSFTSYKMVCDKCDDSNYEKLNLIVSFKQIFSVPWLLCHEQLLDVKYKGAI